MKKWALLREIAAAPTTILKLFSGMETFLQNLKGERNLSEGHCGQPMLWPTFKLKNQNSMSMRCQCPQEIQVPPKESYSNSGNKEQFLSSYAMILQIVTPPFPFVNQKVQWGFCLLKILSSTHKSFNLQKVLFSFLEILPQDPCLLSFTPEPNMAANKPNGVNFSAKSHFLSTCYVPGAMLSVFCG